MSSCQADDIRLNFALSSGLVERPRYTEWDNPPRGARERRAERVTGAAGERHRPVEPDLDHTSGGSEWKRPIPCRRASPAPAPIARRRLAVLIAGGDGVDRAVLRRLASAGTVVAVDSGFDTAWSAGIDVDILIGDLDSVSAEGLAAAEADGVSVERHPVDKDRTDLDLALQRVVDGGFTECARPRRRWRAAQPPARQRRPGRRRPACRHRDPMDGGHDRGAGGTAGPGGRRRR